MQFFSVISNGVDRAVRRTPTILLSREEVAPRRTGSRFRYPPSAASTAVFCLVRAFTDKVFHPLLGILIRPI
jgi:hypothetical protein